ncbi:hypothetical protein QAD02_022950 [Eretmocerus hayati]|uniref:Uncharacterized protein n=1 Tax=Eretmocerus hayati TaxID=131215 RepID=A0ACC2PUF0_9HYME|nr:hypothetical protein QAD02_022950 [Eretmocerus hayati]
MVPQSLSLFHRLGQSHQRYWQQQKQNCRYFCLALRDLSCTTEAPPSVTDDSKTPASKASMNSDAVETRVTKQYKFRILILYDPLIRGFVYFVRNESENSTSKTGKISRANESLVIRRQYLVISASLTRRFSEHWLPKRIPQSQKRQRSGNGEGATLVDDDVIEAVEEVALAGVDVVLEIDKVG